MTEVQPGDLVLVTGANGFIGGVTVQKLLNAGCRVRGTVRDPAKHEWMLSHYGSNFSLVAVPEMSAHSSFTEAVKGVDGIAHVASLVGEGYQPDPHAVIPKAIRSALELLEAAAKESTIKSVVYTSSQAAALFPKPTLAYHITTESWNEESKAACSKMETEQQCFKWVEDHKPHFIFNTVLPNITLGATTRPDMTGFPSSLTFLKLFWQGSTLPITSCPPTWFVDVEDVALLHVAALTQPDIKGERIFAMAPSSNEFFSNRTFLDTVEEVPDNGKVDNERAAELLKRFGNADGFTKLEDSVQKWITQVLQEEKAKEEGSAWPDISALIEAQISAGLPE